MDPYQDCINYVPRVKIAPASGVIGGKTAAPQGPLLDPLYVTRMTRTHKKNTFKVFENPVYLLNIDFRFMGADILDFYCVASELLHAVPKHRRK